MTIQPDRYFFVIDPSALRIVDIYKEQLKPEYKHHYYGLNSKIWILTGRKMPYEATIHRSNEGFLLSPYFSTEEEMFAFLIDVYCKYTIFGNPVTDLV